MNSVVTYLRGTLPFPSDLSSLLTGREVVAPDLSFFRLYLSMLQVIDPAPSLCLQKLRT